MVELTVGDLDSDDDGEDDDYTTERILRDKPDASTLGRRLYKVRWKGFDASRDSWEPLSSFVPRYTTEWLNYLKKRGIGLDVKDVLPHLIMHERDSDESPLTPDTIVCFSLNFPQGCTYHGSIPPKYPIPIFLT